MKNLFFEKTKGGLIVSCQALPGEPLHGPHIMACMANAAMLGGAVGIRANSVEDIAEIRKSVALPMIGIIKRQYGDSGVYITPTIREVSELASTSVEVIAIDATCRPRPGGLGLEPVFREIRRAYPRQLFMADCATYDECVFAQSIGFDIVATTMCGYTDETSGTRLPNYRLLRRLGRTMGVPVIAEGGIWEPRALAKIMGIPGIHACVVGSAITRPLEITRRFAGTLHAR